MCIYILIYIYACLYLYTYSHVFMCMYLCIHIYIHIYAHANQHLSVCKCIFFSFYARIYTYIYIHMCIYVCIHVGYYALCTLYYLLCRCSIAVDADTLGPGPQVGEPSSSVGLSPKQSPGARPKICRVQRMSLKCPRRL